MSMVTSCTHVLSRAAPPAKLPHGALQSGKPAAMALQMKHRPLSVRCAAGHSLDFDIKPFALVHPKFPPTSGDDWRIKEDKEHVKLWFHVGDKARKDDLEVRVEDDVLLVRWIKSAVDPPEPASSLDVRLLVPNGYDKKKVEAELTFGSLLVTIGKKPVDAKIESIEISPPKP